MGNSDDALENYSKLLKEFDGVKREVSAMVNVIVTAAEALKKDFRTVQVANVEASFPLDILRAASIDGKSWPTGQQIGTMLAKYHTALAAAKAARAQIPGDGRFLVDAPKP